MYSSVAVRQCHRLINVIEETSDISIINRKKSYIGQTYNVRSSPVRYLRLLIRLLVIQVSHSKQSFFAEKSCWAIPEAFNIIEASLKVAKSLCAFN